MKRIFLLSIVAFMIVNLGLYAQEETTQTDPKLQLVPVYEKTFQDTIVDVIFDTATVSIERAKKMGWKDEAFNEEEKRTGKATISYPKVVFVSSGKGHNYWGWYISNKGSSKRVKELKFYSENDSFIRGLEIGKDSAQYIYLSPQKKYILVSKIPWEFAPNHTGGSLYNLNGKEIWEIKGSTPIAVSDEGYAVAAYLDWQVPPEVGGDFYIYDSKGHLLTTIKNPMKKKTAPLFAEYSNDGRYVLLCFSREFMPTIFLLINRKGEILWKNELSEFRMSTAVGGGSKDILRDEGVTGTVVKGKGTFYAFLINWKGNLKWLKRLNSWGTWVTLFSKDGERVYLCSNRGYIGCIKKSNGDIIWAHDEWLPKSRSSSLDVLKFSEMYENSNYLIIREGSSTIFLFDSKTGKLRAKIEYSGGVILLSPHNNRIFIIDVKNNRILGLKIEEVLK